ncbi:hypothetical protein IRJ41_010745 [Triplophysa rosa]|uniref:Uncharacterized protein n=1 Tax=Triplophysa rosa TaxID=992332 RepID=A0A9W7X5C7_TRIRA|nr:hypothetical protein IRJ41_010745 [Triplophysa rosa]
MTLSVSVSVCVCPCQMLFLEGPRSTGVQKQQFCDTGCCGLCWDWGIWQAFWVALKDSGRRTEQRLERVIGGKVPDSRGPEAAEAGDTCQHRDSVSSLSAPSL